ncbi:hypothetical protein VNI00_005816 [Paramarasmius palmivorus]|uniref:RQC domain-containing protein n=1 Tax=Paramarasmius palmivorus TaxID=297713 RepID=A0AAW0DA85_9AGAR
MSHFSNITVRRRKTPQRDVIEISDSDTSPQLKRRPSAIRELPEPGPSQKRSKFNPSHPSQEYFASSHGVTVAANLQSVKQKLSFNYKTLAETSNRLSSFYDGRDPHADAVVLERISELTNNRVHAVKNQMELLNTTITKTASSSQDSPLPRVQTRQAATRQTSPKRFDEKFIKDRLRQVFSALPSQKVIKTLLQILQGLRTLTIDHSASETSFGCFLAALSRREEGIGITVIVSSFSRPDDKRLALVKRNGVNVGYWEDNSVPTNMTTSQSNFEYDVLWMTVSGFLQSFQTLDRLTTSSLIERMLIDNMSGAWRQKDVITGKAKRGTLSKWFAGQNHVLVLVPDFDIAQVFQPQISFVLHYELPDTLSEYFYQTSLAGGDGGVAECVLYYDCRDLKSLRLREEQRQLLDFCRNESQCHRVGLLQSVGETYIGGCQSCGVCETRDAFVDCDLTVEAQAASRLIQRLSSRNVSLRYCREVFAGHRTAEVRNNRDNDLEQFGAGSSLPYDQVEQLFEELYLLDAWQEVEDGDEEWDTVKMQAGPTVPRIFERDFQLVLRVRGPPIHRSHTKTPEHTLPLYRDDTDEGSLESLHQAIPELPTARLPTEEREVPVDLNHQHSVKLFESMKLLRQTLRIELGLSCDEDVLDDSTIEMLSICRPAGLLHEFSYMHFTDLSNALDYQGFKQILKDNIPSSLALTPDEYVELKWRQHGQRFLKICIGVDAGGSR